MLNPSGAGKPSGVIELVLPHGPLRPAKLMPACFITERDTSTTLTSTCTTPPVPAVDTSTTFLSPTAAPGEPGFEAEHITYRPAAQQGYAIEREGDGVFRVAGRGVEMLIARHDLSNPEALAYLEQRLTEMGVVAALRSAGFEPGDEVRIGEEEFELDPG